MTKRIFTVAFCALAMTAAAANAQEEGEAVEAVAAAPAAEAVMAATESAAEILGKPKLLPAVAKLPDGACNDGLYQDAAMFLVLPAEAPQVGDVIALSDYTDPRTGESVAEAKGFSIVKRKSDFTASEGQAKRSSYTYYLAYNAARDCD
ncbi:hypothetical protein ACQ5SO_01995 [Rhodovulum sp. DZ06]|uniref:hypothetical protein n=1 Tax=Rhodovulum sp. DZ06 TaxID=3425126 RepID=UPI003D32B0B7